MDWSGTDVTNTLDLKALEDLFGQDSETKPKTPGKVYERNDDGLFIWLCICLALTKKVELKSLLDQTRARNIEIFLPSFPLSLEQLTSDSLGECLNSLSEDSTLNLDHIVALKR